MLQLRAGQARRLFPGCVNLCEDGGLCGKGVLLFRSLLHRFRRWVCLPGICTSSPYSWALMGDVPFLPVRCEGPGLLPGCTCTVT